MRVRLIPIQKGAKENAVVKIPSMELIDINALAIDPPVAERTLSGMIGKTQTDVISLIKWCLVNIL